MDNLRRSAKIGTYDTYQQQSNPLVVQNEDGSWTDLTVGDLISLIAEGVKDANDAAAREAQKGGLSGC